jgi:hypothetical protein
VSEERFYGGVKPKGLSLKKECNCHHPSTISFNQLDARRDYAHVRQSNAVVVDFVRAALPEDRSGFFLK